jgi:hypothetical protein
MKINCISCGHDTHLDDHYDNYEGAIRCWGCNCLMEVRIEDGDIRSVKRLLDNSKPTISRQYATPQQEDVSLTSS